MSLFDKVKDFGPVAVDKVIDLKEKSVDVANAIKDKTVDVKDKAVDVALSAKDKTKELIVNAKEDFDRAMLKPVFQSDIIDADFKLPRMIHILEYDKQHQDNPVCEGSIGFYTDKGMPVLNIYSQYADLLKVTFIPFVDEDVYYVDPYDQTQYISFNEYFKTIESKKVAELCNIASSLGAKHVVVAVEREAKQFISKNKRSNVNALKSSANADINAVSSTSADLVYKTEKILTGSEPSTPEIKYFANDDNIKSLINMRLGNSVLLSDNFTLQYHSSSDIKQNEAIKIDAALQHLKCNGNISISSEIEEQGRLKFHYEIEF